MVETKLCATRELSFIGRRSRHDRIAHHLKCRLKTLRITRETIVGGVIPLDVSSAVYCQSCAWRALFVLMLRPPQLVCPISE